MIEKLRILFVHEVNYLTKPIYEMHEFPEHLAERGHEIAFLHFPEGWTHKQVKSQGFRSKISGRVVFGVTLNLFTPQLFWTGLIGRFFMVLIAANNFRKTLKSFNPDVVVSFSVPTSGWQALRVSKGLGVPYVFRALDVSHKIRNTPFETLIKLAEKFIYRKADWVSANNPAMAQYCISNGAMPGMLSTEFPPMNLDEYRADSSTAQMSRSALGIPEDAKVAVYLGSFFYFSGLKELVTSFLTFANPDEYLLLVGGGELDEELRKLGSTHAKAKQLIFTGFVPFELVTSYLQIADVAVNPMEPTLVSNSALPNKVIQYLACGLPVVSTRLDGLRAVFSELADLHLVSSPGEVWSAAMSIVNQKPDGSKQINPDQVNELLQERFSLNETLSAFEVRLKSVLKSKS